MAVQEKSWLETIKAKRRKKTFIALAFMGAAMSVWLGLSALGVWAWIAVFHHVPPGLLFLKWYLGLGSAIIIPLSAIAPLAPMKGKDPEILAADEFFKGPPR